MTMMSRRFDGGSGTTLRRILISTLFISFLSGACFVSIFHLKYAKLVKQDVASNGWSPDYRESENESLSIDTNKLYAVDKELQSVGHSFIRGEKIGHGEAVDDEGDAIETITTASNRLFCMVPFIWSPRYLPSYHAIHATWGKRCHILRFMIDPIIGDDNLGYYNMTLAADVIAAANSNLTLPTDVVVLHDMRRPWHTCLKPGVDNCRNIWEKIWRSWVYVVTGKGGSTPAGSNIKHDTNINDVYKAEWFVKVDADTWLFPENLRRFVKSRNWSYNDHHYFGHVLRHRVEDRGVPIVAGTAVFFSRKTLLAAADSFQKMPLDNGNEEEDGTCRDAYTGTEEVVTAVCLKEHSNITADPAIDPQGREYIAIGKVDDVIMDNRTQQGEWWFWEGKQRFPCHDEGDCLAYLPLAFHDYKEKETDYFLDLEKEFYGSVMNGDEDDSLAKRNDNKIAARNWNNFDTTHEYFERIRTAMRAAAKADEASLRISDTEPSTAKDKNRLYCMVPFLWAPKYLPSYAAIRNTWGKRCDVLKFFIDPIIEYSNGNFVDLRHRNGANVVLPEDVVVLYDVHRPWHVCASTKDGNCRNIWEKVWRSWLWIDNNGDSDLAEWFVKVDSDTYLFPENAKKYVEEKNWLPDEHHYFGHKLRHAEIPIIAGASVFLSRATVKGAAAIFREFIPKPQKTSGRKCMDAHSTAEEVYTALCLKQYLGIVAEHSLGELGDELIIVSEIEDSLLWNRTQQGEWWYWKNKPKTDPKTGREIHYCCGDSPIAFHGYKDPLWFYKLENEFYEMDELPGVSDKWKEYKWRNSNETNSYFDRVRKAMNARV